MLESRRGETYGTDQAQGLNLGSALNNIGGFVPGIGIEADGRGKLERLCRYISRPAVAEERLALTERGDVRLQLKTGIATVRRT
jgi:hypothetical protein